MDKINYTDKVKELGPWFHNIHLPDGTQTAPEHFYGDFPSYKWEEIAIAIPEDLTGLKVLDVGCNAGFYSIQLAKRGAIVTAIDVDAHYLKQAEWVAECFGLEKQISFKQMQVYDAIQLNQEFDLIWFMGVFYHLRYPILALDILSSICKDKMIFQTLSFPGEESHTQVYDVDINDRKTFLDKEWPKLAFIEHQFAGDPTNWWLANNAVMKALLRSAGFLIKAEPAHETILAMKDPTRQSSLETWNKSEFLSALQKEWVSTVDIKTGKH